MKLRYLSMGVSIVCMIVSIMLIIKTFQLNSLRDEVEQYLENPIITLSEQIIKAEGSIKLEDKTFFMEYAYFEGQLDAISGNVRIEKLENGDWEWIKSPWDSNPFNSRKPSLQSFANYIQYVEVRF